MGKLAEGFWRFMVFSFALVAIAMASTYSPLNIRLFATPHRA
jgi:hypothetical protein